MNCDNSSHEGKQSGTTDGGGNEVGEEDESDPSSSPHSDLNAELNQFRREWRREIENSPLPEISSEQREMEARDLYLKGVEAERKGQLCDAIYFYRRAVQIVPDIEFRVATWLSQTKTLIDDKDSNSDDEFHLERDEYMELAGDEDEDLEMDDLLARFTRLCNRSNKICHPNFVQTSCHISILPSEILFYICKWVISSELDMRSLEQMSKVCRGFYLCARDAELWRIACMRVWGNNCGLPNKYESWRSMYIKRPRLQYNGVYISKTTYVRAGEPAFQDLTYRPWHLVEYYRYVRFFPGGFLHMMTTPEEPAISVSKLRQRNVKNQAILSGHYRINGSIITAVMKRTKTPEVSLSGSSYRYRRHQQTQVLDNQDQTFHLEFEVMTYKNKANFKLEWRHYSVKSMNRNGQDNVSEFNLSNVKYPPLWFSRVKSFTAVSDRPL